MITRERISWVVEELNKLSDENFTGSVQINFFKGGVSNINKAECIKPPSSKENDNLIPAK